MKSIIISECNHFVLRSEGPWALFAFGLKTNFHWRLTCEGQIIILNCKNTKNLKRKSERERESENE